MLHDIKKEYVYMPRQDHEYILGSMLSVFFILLLFITVCGIHHLSKPETITYILLVMLDIVKQGFTSSQYTATAYLLEMRAQLVPCYAPTKWGNMWVMMIQLKSKG